MFIYDFNQGGFVALPQCLDDFRMNFDNYPAYWFLFQSRDTGHSKLPVHVIVRTANDYEQKQTTQEFQLLGDDSAVTGWLRGTMSALEPFSLGHYINNEDIVSYPERNQRSFTPDSWAKLRALRKRYDPSGVFHDYYGA